MNPRIPRYSTQETGLFKDLTAKIVVELAGSDLSEEARNAAPDVILKTSRAFIFERPRPVLRLVR